MAAATANLGTVLAYGDRGTQAASASSFWRGFVGCALCSVGKHMEQPPRAFAAITINVSCIFLAWLALRCQRQLLHSYASPLLFVCFVWCKQWSGPSGCHDARCSQRASGLPVDSTPCSLPAQQPKDLGLRNPITTYHA